MNFASFIEGTLLVGGLNKHLNACTGTLLMVPCLTLSKKKNERFRLYLPSLRFAILLGRHFFSHELKRTAFPFAYIKHFTNITSYFLRKIICEMFLKIFKKWTLLISPMKHVPYLFWVSQCKPPKIYTISEWRDGDISNRVPLVETIYPSHYLMNFALQVWCDI